MISEADQQLIDAWQAAPAPLLPMLHAFHDRDGYLSESSIRAVSEALKIPLAELYGTVTFYHHFSREAPGKEAPRVCTGNVCCKRGGNELLESLGDQGATAMPCAGRCDEPVPVIWGDRVLVGTTKDDLQHVPSPMPVTNPGEIEECVFRGIREEGRSTLAGYQATGGYEGLKKALAGTPEELVTVITESKLAGRGGAGRERAALCHNRISTRPETDMR